MTGRPSRMRIASIADLDLGGRVRKRESKERKNTDYGSLSILSAAEFLSCLGPGWFPLGVVPRAKPVPLLLDIVIAISPPMLRQHEGSRLSVVGFIIAGSRSRGTCGHIVYLEVGRS